MIQRVVEGETTWLSSLGVSDIPNALPKGISIHLKSGKVGLEIQGLVGAFPLLNGDTLQIIPKIGQVNFLRLLFKAEGLHSDLEKAYEDFVKYSLDDERNVDSLVSRQLAIAAGEILSKSPRQGRTLVRKTGAFAAGQMDTVGTALNIAQRKLEPVVYVARERTFDTSENRVISEALVRSWPFVSEAGCSELLGIRDRWLARFPRSCDLGTDLGEVEEGFAAARFGGPRDYYRRALMLSKIILGSNGLGFTEVATIEGDAVLLNTPDIFEKYLRNVIAAAYGKAGFVVTKGGIGTTCLYTDGSYELLPDIVVSSGDRTLLVADAKYKQPTAGDHYQMHTYLSAQGVKRGLLLAPGFHQSACTIRQYSTSNKTVVTEAYLPMGDLNATEAFLGSVIEQFA